MLLGFLRVRYIYFIISIMQSDDANLEDLEVGGSYSSSGHLKVVLFFLPDIRWFGGVPLISLGKKTVKQPVYVSTVDEGALNSDSGALFCCFALIL